MIIVPFLFQSIAFLKNARKKWTKVNPNQLIQSAADNNRLPSTPKLIVQTEPPEYDESDESSEESSSQSNKLPGLGKYSGSIDGIDKAFMLEHCQGYAKLK